MFGDDFVEDVVELEILSAEEQMLRRSGRGNGMAANIIRAEEQMIETEMVIDAIDDIF